VNAAAAAMDAVASVSSGIPIHLPCFEFHA
jgi:hypothetical protein